MKKILILGGGTAGWMMANALVSALDKAAFKVCLVESPSIGTIGVGEGSTPHLKLFFDRLGIAEETWMPECNATYKNGISFINWTEHLNENRYFHPFPSILDRQTAMTFLQHCIERHKGKDIDVNPDHYFLARALSKNALSPKTAPNKPKLPVNYAYHFDSVLLGNFLEKEGKARGVTHIRGLFVKAHNCDEPKSDKQNIRSIKLEDGSVHSADFFIDASGFKSLLLQEHLGVGFTSFSNNLFNDSAIALASDIATPLLAETKATALGAGWAWHIPLLHRTGNGYVFSSRYIDFDQAEAELRQHLLDSNQIVDPSTEARKIKMKVGQVQQAWKGNVMAIGLAQGFIEPLEATALHLVMDSIELFLGTFTGGEYTSASVEQFNLAVKQRYEGIRDYIVCHYKVNTKAHHDGSDIDSDNAAQSNDQNSYWHDCASNDDISDNLQAVLTAWENKQDITPILEKRSMTKFYPAISWYCLLAGYGYFEHAPLQSKPSAQALQNMSLMRRFIENSSGNFVAHSDALIK